MLVNIAGFGSIWSHRTTQDHTAPNRFARGAYYNTTGVLVAGSFRHAWRVGGQVRFNGVGGFDPHHPWRAIGRVFSCKEPEVWNGHNRILFHHALPRPESPDYFLIVLRSDIGGTLRLENEPWRSKDVLLVSLSESSHHQEVMLLMPPGSWVRTDAGLYSMEPIAGSHWKGQLQLGGAA